MKMKAILISTLIFLFPAALLAQNVMYMDESGNIHFVHSLQQVPKEYRHQLVDPNANMPTDKKEYTKMLKAMKKEKAKKAKEKKKQEKLTLKKEKQLQRKNRRKKKKELKIASAKQKEQESSRAQPKVIGKEPESE